MNLRQWERNRRETWNSFPFSMNEKIKSENKMIQLKSNNYYEITDIEIQYFLKTHFNSNIRLKDIIPNCEIGNYYVFKIQRGFVIPDIRYNIQGFKDITDTNIASIAIGKELQRLKDAKELDCLVIIVLLMNCGIIASGDYVISITV